MRFPPQCAFAVFVPRFPLFVCISVCAAIGAIAADKPVARPSTLHLTLHKAVELALAKNFSLEVARIQPKIAQQIYAQATITKMCVRHFQGEAMEKTLSWAESECEGFMRS